VEAGTIVAIVLLILAGAVSIGAIVLARWSIFRDWFEPFFRRETESDKHDDP
jgi:hypothetical protein